MNWIFGGIVLLLILNAASKGALGGFGNLIQAASPNLSSALSVFSTPISVKGSGSGTQVGISGQANNGTNSASTNAVIEAGVSSSLGIAASLLGLSTVTGPAAPFVAAAAGLVGIFSSIFKGANPLQVDATQIQEIYIACSLNCEALFEKLQMITQAQCIAAMQALISAGVNAENEYSGQIGKPAQAGAQTLTTAINQDIAGVQSFPEIGQTVPISVSLAHTVYVGSGTGLYGAAGWDNDSITLASELTDAFLQSLQQTVTPAIPVSGILTELEALL